MKDLFIKMRETFESLKFTSSYMASDKIKMSDKITRITLTPTQATELISGSTLSFKGPDGLIKVRMSK